MRKVMGVAVLIQVFACQGNIVSRPLNEAQIGQEGIDPTTCQVSEGRVVARRLSRTEYDNTLRDLFPKFDVGAPSKDFPEDVTGGDETNNVGLGVSDLFLEKHEATVTALSAKALANGFITCTPKSPTDKACARTVLEPLMYRAWRRPPTAAEVDDVLKTFDVVATEPMEPKPFEKAVDLSLQQVLMSPHFLFRFEVLAEPSSPTSQPLGAFHIASRLSYFIYESTPDTELLEAAKSGALLTPEGLEAQVRRMLQDPRSIGLAQNLSRAWLQANRADLVNPLASTFPKFGDDLRQGFQTETAMFIRDFLLSERPYADMMDADFSFVNARLAEHYQLPTTGLTTEFSRVSLSSKPERGGVLTHGSVLAGTSAPHNDPSAAVVETNVIVRGSFVLHQMLCQNLPPPPEGIDVNAVQADAQKEIPAGSPRKVREGVRMSNAVCAQCHQHMDPIGYSLEHFDVTGAWRTIDAQKTTVDSTGTLNGADAQPVGKFDGARSMASLIKKDPRFASCLSQTMLQVGLGRPVTKAEQCRMSRVAYKTGKGGGRLSSMVLAIVSDPSFTLQEGEAP